MEKRLLTIFYLAFYGIFTWLVYQSFYRAVHPDWFVRFTLGCHCMAMVVMVLHISRYRLSLLRFFFQGLFFLVIVWDIGARMYHVHQTQFHRLPIEDIVLLGAVFPSWYIVYDNPRNRCPQSYQDAYPNWQDGVYTTSM